MVYHALSQKEAKEFDIQVQCLATSLEATEAMTKMALWLLRLTAILDVLSHGLLLNSPVDMLGSVKVSYCDGLFPYAGLLFRCAKVKFG